MDNLGSAAGIKAFKSYSMLVDVTRTYRAYESEQVLGFHSNSDKVRQWALLVLQQMASSTCVFTSFLSLGYYLSGKSVPVRLGKIHQIGEITWVVCECIRLRMNTDTAEKQDYGVLIAVLVKLVAEKVWQGNRPGAARRIAACSVEIANLIQIIGTCKASPSQVRASQKTKEPQCIPDHKVIKKQLDSVVIGQEEAKQTLALQAWMHLKNAGDPDYQPNNILLQGPSGSGKTLLLQTLAKSLDIPFAIVDASGFSPAAYQGTPLTAMLAQLLEKADGDIERAQTGIVFIDEIDKIAKDSMSGKGTGQKIQSELLTLVEGRKVRVPTGLLQSKYIDTSKILFVVGGAFEGLKAEGRADLQALIDYGLKLELVGRFGCMAVCKPLSKKELVSVLKDSKNSVLKAKKRDVSRLGVTLTFTDGAIQALAQKALKLPTGVRGLRFVLNTLLDPILFKLSTGDHCEITETEVEGL